MVRGKVVPIRAFQPLNLLSQQGKRRAEPQKGILLYPHMGTAGKRYYRATLKEQNMAYSELEKAGLDRKQKRIVDKVFTAINANGAAYGKVAYKLGLHDGIRLMSEVNKI